MRATSWGTGRGSYWSNYLGWDRSGDGMGDVQYGANDMVDRLTACPSIKLLLASPPCKRCAWWASGFPFSRVPSVVDPTRACAPTTKTGANGVATFPGQ